jgi:hypothetical protein
MPHCGAIRRPYRSAFHQPMPLSDADDNGASFEHAIGESTPQGLRSVRSTSTAAGIVL